MVVRLGHTTAAAARRTADTIRALSTGSLVLVVVGGETGEADKYYFYAQPEPKETGMFGRRKAEGDPRRRMRPFEAAVVAAGAVYLLVLGWAMQSLSYDIWGALVVVPILALISAPLILRAFTGDLALLRPWVWAGMFVKFAGAVVGYSVRFDAYGGSADAGRYHAVGKELAGAVRDGSASLFEVLPSSTGTRSIEEFTGLVYTIFGSSRIGGFMVFTWLSFWGLVFFVKAAHHAVPRPRHPPLPALGDAVPQPRLLGLEHRQGSRRRVLPRPHGLRRRARARAAEARSASARILIAIGLSGSAFVRPHFAAIWAGAIVIALASRGRARRDGTIRARRRPASAAARLAPARGDRRYRLRRHRQHHPQLPRPVQRRRRSDDRPVLVDLRTDRETDDARAGRRSRRSRSTAPRTGPTPPSAPSPARC